MERTVDILIEISIYSAVITAFILLFRAAFKKRISPKVQYAMWLLLVLRLMLPVTIESGFHVESLLPERTAPVVQEESIFDKPVISEIPAVNMAPVTEVAPVQPDFDTQGEEFTPAISQETPESTVVTIPEVKEPVFNIRWRIAAFWTWIAGAMAFGLWMMIVKLRFYEDMQRHTTSVSPRVYAIYDECCAALKVKPLTMWAVDRAISPGIAFFTYPVLLLPASMDGDEEKLRYAFLHELTHKKRHDHHMTALLTALRVIYWFNPAVHIGFSEMRADMETACDAEVIAFVGKEQKRGYLTAILELFSYATRPQLGMSQASSRRMAKQRMKGAFMRERTTFLGRAAALMLAIILLVGCFTTACQSAPVEVEETAESEVVDIQPESVIDVDGDGIEDSITLKPDDYSAEDFDPEKEKLSLIVELSTGETLIEEIPGCWRPTQYYTADFNSDGKTDIALMLGVAGSNYGATQVYVYHVENGKLVEYPNNVIKNDVISYDQSKCTSLNNDLHAVWMEGSRVIIDEQKPMLRLHQLLDYAPGVVVSTAYYINLSWRSNGWFIESMEIGDAFDHERPYPGTLQPVPKGDDSIDALSGMDLLTYAALEQGNGTYALPRTLSGNDLATEIWDRIMINVNNQYFSSMPYDAAGAAYNVVAVTQDANSGIIDVYTILTYRRYTLLNDELSVDGELNCAVIWSYKENESGEIEFSNVYWPIKDSKGRVSYGNREWSEDLQKYTDFSPDSIGRTERLKAIEEQIAISMDNTTKVGSLLGTITSSPKGSSARIDYINEHVGEYGQLCAMGRRAVSRFMPRFEKGYETGLEGQIMAAVLNALIGVDSLNDYENGQAWYDANRTEILAYMRAADEKATLQTAAEAFLTMYFDKMCDRDSGLDYARDKYTAQNGQLLLAEDNYNDMMLLRQWIDHKDMLADFGYNIQRDCGRFASLDVHNIQPVQNGELLQNGDYVLKGYFKTTAFGTFVELGMMDTGGVFAITSVAFPDWKEYNNFCNDFIAFMKDKGYTDYGKSSYIDAKRKEWEEVEKAISSSYAFSDAIVDRAEQLIGKKHEVDAYGPETFDSAGLVYYVLFNEGVEVTKQSCQEYSKIDSWKKIEDTADLQPGDIMFFYGDDFAEINHTGIYIGNSKMIDASSANGKVTERSWETDYWQEHFAFARRVA